MTTHASCNAVSSSGPPQPDAPGERCGYFVVGAGTPVVMLHSSLSSKSQWTALAERLAPRFRVIALDLCGYGDNAVPAAGTSFSVDDEVQLVTDHLDRLVEPHVRVHLVGHSYGGLVALRWAQCRGDRVASLSLYEPVVFRMLDDGNATLMEFSRRAGYISRLVAGGRREEAARAFVDFWSGDGSYAALPAQARSAIARRIDKVPLDFQAASRWPPSPAEFRAIAAPTLLLAGNRSPSVAQSIVAMLARELPDRHVHWFDAGHMGPITDAQRINPWIEAFVDICEDSQHASLAARAAVASASAARWTPAEP